MGRTLKRVPVDFNWPIGKVWYGYLNFCHCSDDCDGCKEFAQTKGYLINDVGCPEYPELEALREPPQGAGYQLWETTSEGSPQSPVFISLKELCEWCEANATTFASYTASAEEWEKMLSADFVCAREGDAIFI